MEELIKLYEELIHGTETNMGLLDCLDRYYSGAFTKEVVNIELLKQKLKI